MEERHIRQHWLGYSALAVDETDEASSEKQEVSDWNSSSRSRPSKTTLFLTLANVTIFLSTAMMLFKIHRTSPARVLNADLRATSSYSPVFDIIDLEPSIKTINGSIFPPYDPSIARQFPNPQADAIWEEDIELIRPIPITREQVLKLGKNPDTVAKFEDSLWGLGDDAYVAALDIFHDLHCLNTLRRAAYGTYYNITAADRNGVESFREIHLNHCIDILYQHLSCSNNVNLVTRHWREGLVYPSPDFSINKQCIDFEKLKRWHKDASVDMTKWREKMKKPAGVKQEPKMVFSAEEWLEESHIHA